MSIITYVLFIGLAENYTYDGIQMGETADLQVDTLDEQSGDGVDDEIDNVDEGTYLLPFTHSVTYIIT